MVRIAAALAVIAIVAAPALSAPCRDAKTKRFVKCPQAASAASAPAITKDAKGKCHIASGPKKGTFTPCS